LLRRLRRGFQLSGQYRFCRVGAIPHFSFDAAMAVIGALSRGATDRGGHTTP
jgi:hypothetical protein